MPLYYSNMVQFNITFLNRRIDTASTSSFSSTHLSVSPYQVAYGSWYFGANARPWCEMAELGRNESKQSFPVLYKYKENVKPAKPFLHSTNYCGICKHMPDGALSS